MSDSIPNSKIPCTYPDCKLVFETEKQMRRHKKSDPNHEYCHICDEDFLDCQELFLHKVKKDIHNICPVCTMEFGSVGGLEVHIRQSHRTKQNIVCQGCSVKFTSASAIMVHIEKGECREISMYRVLQEQAKKLMIKEALKEGGGDSSSVTPSDYDHDGGVSIYSLPKENKPITAPKALLAIQPVGDLIDFDAESVVTTNTRASGWEAKGPSGPIQSPRPFGIGVPAAGETIRAFNPKWDANKFFNSFSSQYICTCGKAFAEIAGFEEHLIQKAQKNQRVRCPGCQRIFKSMSALVAHCETGSRRCDINTSDLFGLIMDEMTGGVVQVAGYHQDGSLKYEAGELELERHITVGTKW